MPNVHPKPILNASLPTQFRRIRIELAREPGHPGGDAAIAYIIVAPVDTDGRIDPDLWRTHRDACRIARLRPDAEDGLGHLVHQGGGSWAFHYDSAPSLLDEVGFHFADECFVAGEYVSIKEGSKLHTYRVVSVSHL